MGHLCLLGALCCTYAPVTFRKYFHKAFEFKCYKHSGGNYYVSHTCCHNILCQNQDRDYREQSQYSIYVILYQYWTVAFTSRNFGGSCVVFTTWSDGCECVCVCTSYIRSAPQCQCFIWLEIFNESADKRVVFLCSLVRAVFTDTHPHPAVLLKLAPAAATLRISQGVQFHVWVACWWIFYSKTILIFYSKTISKAYLKDCFWFPRRTLEPSRIFWLSAQLKHLILEEGYQNYACGWLLKMTWVGRPKSPLPQRERTSVDIHTTHKMMLQSWLWAMLVYVWCTGIQDINNITISKSSGKFKPLRNNSEETAETNVQ